GDAVAVDEAVSVGILDDAFIALACSGSRGGPLVRAFWTDVEIAIRIGEFGLALGASGQLGHWRFSLKSGRILSEAAGLSGDASAAKAPHLRSFCSGSALLRVDGRGQLAVVGVDDEHREQLGGLGLARIGADIVPVTRHLGEVLTLAEGAHRTAVDLVQ